MKDCEACNGTGKIYAKVNLANPRSLRALNTNKGFSIILDEEYELDSVSSFSYTYSPIGAYYGNGSMGFGSYKVTLQFFGGGSVSFNIGEDKFKVENHGN